MSLKIENIDDFKGYINHLKLESLYEIYHGIDETKYPDRLALVKNVIDNYEHTTEEIEEKEKAKKIEKYKTFWPRLFAGIIDGFVILPIVLLIEYLSTNFTESYSILFIIFFQSVLIYSYSILFHGFKGQTLGKIVTQVMVLDVSENKLSMKQAVIRDFIPIFFSVCVFLVLFGYVFQGGNITENDIALTGWYAIVLTVANFVSMFWFIAELITMLSNKKRRAVHDFIAKSVVVNV